MNYTINESRNWRKLTKALFMFKRVSIWLVCLTCWCKAGATDVHFDLSKFNASPADNRTVLLQPLQPMPGNLITNASGDDGTFTYANAKVADYVVSIRALGSAAAITFQITVTATNLGTVEADTITSQLGIQTYPTSGKSSWTIQAADGRYQLSGTTLSNVFYPLYSNPSNYASLGTVTNIVSAAIPTNFWSSSASAWMSNLVFTGSLTTNKYVAGTLMSSTTNSAGLVTFTANVQTNGFSSLVFSNPATILTTNFLPGGTNGFVDKSITNNAATISLLNSASNTLAVASAALGSNLTNDVNTTSNALNMFFIGKADTNAFWGSVRLVHPNGTATNLYASTAALRGTAITQAQALATSGDTIYVFGDAVVSNSLGKDGVNWQLGEITLSAITNVDLFLVSNMTFSVSGQANLYATNASVFDSAVSTAPSFITVNCRSAVSFGPDSGGRNVFDIDNGETGGEWVINVSELIQSHEEDAIVNGGLADVTVTCPVIVASHDVFNNFPDSCTLRVRAIQLGSTFDGAIIDTAESTNFISADSAMAPGVFIASVPVAGSMVRVPFVQCVTIDTSFASGTNRFDGNWADGKISTGGTNIFSGNGSGITNLNASAISSGTLSPARLSLGTSNLIANVAPFAGMTATYTTNASGVVAETLVNGNVLTNGSTLDATKLSGAIPHGSLNTFELTNNWQGIITTKGLNVSGGITNGQATVNTLVKFGANKEEGSLANGSGALTNNGSGGFGYVTLIDLLTVTNVAQSVTVAATGITNVYGTNLPTVLVVGSRAYIPTNFDAAGGSNVLFALNATSSNALASLNTSSSNGLQAFKLSKTNDTSYSQVATNLATMGNVSFGFTGLATNIYGANTNWIKFIDCGMREITNGQWAWDSSLGLYTNSVTGAVYKNNGSGSWLIYTNNPALGLTLYGFTSGSPFGQLGTLVGPPPAPLCVPSFAFDHNGMYDIGFISPTNILRISNSIYALLTSQTTNNFVAENGGFLTNGYLTWATVATLNFISGQFGQTNYDHSTNSAVLSGAFNTVADGANYSIIDGGLSNSIIGGALSFYSTIHGGASNIIVNSRSADIYGGQYNDINVAAEWSQLIGGQSNIITSPSLSLRANGSVILNGLWNKIIGTQNHPYLASDYILGGVSNTSTGVFDWSSGRNVSLSNNCVWAWSDGTPLNSTTNSQVLFAATNGLHLNGALWLNSLYTNGGVYILSNEFSLYAVTNSMPNFASWIGSSNGAPVRIYYSNGVPIMTLIP